MKVSVVGITEEKGRFIQMPSAQTMIKEKCKLLLVGNQKGISRAKRIIIQTTRPGDL